MSDLKKKPEGWEQFSHLNPPHRAFRGKAPYVVLRGRLGVGGMCRASADTSHGLI